MAEEMLQGELVTEAISEDFYREQWNQSQVPGMIKFRLEAVDRRTNCVLVLAEMLSRHIIGTTDANENQGVRYRWLNDRQAHAVSDALHDLAVAASEDLEWIRESYRAGESK